MKTLSRSALVLVIGCAVLITACGSSKSSSSAGSAATSATDSATTAKASTAPASSKCPTPQQLISGLLVNVSKPTSTTGSNGATICNYAPAPATDNLPADTIPTVITFTPNAGAATVAAARTAAMSTDDNVSDLTGVGDAGFQSQRTVKAKDDATIAVGEASGTMISIVSDSGIAEESIYLPQLLGVSSN